VTSSGFPWGHSLPWGIYEKIAPQILIHYRWRARKIERLVGVFACAVVVTIISHRGDGTSSSAASPSASSCCGGGKRLNGSAEFVRPPRGERVITSASANAAWPNGNCATRQGNFSQHRPLKLLRPRLQSARGHAANFFLKIFAIGLAVTIQFDHRAARLPGTAVMSAARLSSVFAIAVASAWFDNNLRMIFDY